MRVDLTDRRNPLNKLRRYLPRIRFARRSERLSEKQFVARARDKSPWQTRQTLVVAAVIAIISAGLGFAFFTQYFNVSKVSVLRSSLDLPLEEIQQLVGEHAFGQNMLRLDVTQLTEDIKATRPDISRVEIEKQLPRTLQVKVIKYPIVAELRVGGERILLNENGYRVDGQTPDRDTIQLVLGEKHDVSDLTVQVVKPDHLVAMRDAAFYFAALMNRPVLHTSYFPMAREAHILTEGNTEIWIDLTEDYRTQLDKLTQGGEQVNLSLQPRYVDLRIRNKIFVMPR